MNTRPGTRFRAAVAAAAATSLPGSHPAGPGALLEGGGTDSTGLGVRRGQRRAPLWPAKLVLLLALLGVLFACSSPRDAGVGEQLADELAVVVAGAEVWIAAEGRDDLAALLPAARSLIESVRDGTEWAAPPGTREALADALRTYLVESRTLDPAEVDRRIRFTRAAIALARVAR